MLEALRAAGLRVGVLSNTIWPRAWHRASSSATASSAAFRRAVYTSEIPWTKPSPRAFEAAMAAVGVGDPGRCVYVGDRLYDDVWGAQQAGMRAVHIPHSVIPAAQVGHTEGTPDAVATGRSGPEIVPAGLDRPPGSLKSVRGGELQVRATQETAPRFVVKSVLVSCMLLHDGEDRARAGAHRGGT